MAEDIVKLLCRSGSYITPVFEPKRVAKYNRVGKFCDFPQKSLSIMETVRDRPVLAMERYKEVM